MAYLNFRRYHELIVPRGKMGIRGLIGWQLVRNGIIIRESPLQPNLVVDGGLNGLFTNSPLSVQLTYCEVGTDNTAPAVTDTSLGSAVTPRTSSDGGFPDVEGYGSGGPDYLYFQRTRVFTEAQANGNLTEVGFFNLITGGVMFNRQLLLDGLGSPTTIVKTSSDQLRIILEVQFWFDLVGQNNILVVDAVNYDTDTRIVNAGAVANSWLGVFPSFAFGGGGQARAISGTFALPATNVNQTVTGFTSANSVTWQAYTAGSFERELEARWEPATANFNHGGWWFNPVSGLNLAGFMTVTDPVLTKINTKRLIASQTYSLVRI